MRRYFRFSRPRFLVAGVLAVAVAAVAGTVTHTSELHWDAGTFINVDNTNDRLELILVEDQVDEWYRHPWNEVDFEAQAQKDDGTVFSAGDRCLRDADNAAINGPTALVGGHEFRTGTGTENISGTAYVSSIPATTLVPLPTGMTRIDEVRFLTGGARIAQTNYTVRFHYSDATTAAVNVPIKVDTTTGAARNANGTNYSVVGITVLDAFANNTWDANGNGTSDCAGDGGDDVIVTNPQPNKNVTDIEFEYVEYGDATASSGWLGGPIAVSLVTSEAQMENTFTYRGEWISPVATGQAVNAGSNAIWYQMAWSATNISPTTSEILVHVTCGNDSNGNGTLDAAEMATERTYELSGLTSPFNFPNQCRGRYLRYRVEPIAGPLGGDPRLNSISFTFDPDADGDGFGADGTATAEDCDDTRPTVYPGANEITGNGIDENCDTDERCYADADNDGSRHATNTVNSNDTDCGDANEGASTDPIDCNDNDPTRYVGANELVADGIDQNCDGHDACYRDLDQDGRGSNTTVTSVGATCQTANQESLFNDDCDDGNANRFPTNPETPGNNVDNDCNDRELCYTDADNDGARLNTTFQTNAGDHNCTGANEGVAGDPLDCDDADPSVRPGATEVTGNNKDDDCNGTASCFRDVDNDGARTNVAFNTNQGDTDCNDAFEGEIGDPIDCNDNDSAVKPGIAEVVGNSQDDNCDNVEDCYVDADNDGARTATVDPGGTNNDADCNDANEGMVTEAIDCNDANPFINPAATELPGDNVDQNCDTRELCYTDADNDGARLNTTFLTGVNDTSCNGANEGVASDPLDCNDTNSAIRPGVAELTGDGVDQNCDNVETCWDDADNDNDRHATNTRNSVDTDCNDANEALSSAVIDCDDNDPQRFSANPEVVGNEKDNDCNNAEICWADADNDDARHGTNTVVSADQDCRDANEAPTSFPLDCDDNDATAYPGNTEIIGNNNDNDCNGQEICYDDADNDNFRHPTNTRVSNNESCNNANEGQATDGIDCDDNRALTNPAAVDTCGNGIDDNCNGVGDNGFPDYLDDDGDGLVYAVEQGIGTNDCDNDSDNDNLTDSDEHLRSHTNPTDADSDNDNVNDGVEVGNNPSNPRNTDGDSFIDALDNDDDNDGLLSNLEDTNGDNNPFNDDVDLDGVKNMWDTDDDNDGVSTRNENVDNDATWSDDNADGDGLPDWIDPDDDNDGILTINENWNGIGDARDDNSDGDGLPDYRDPDDDNDSVPTVGENVNGIGDARDDNTDGDGLPNYRDTDDDNDTIFTLNEYSDPPNRDVDGDGVQNHLDLDSDGDGYTDQNEGRIASDTDNVFDYLDTDSDNDTVLDANELNEDLDGDNKRNRVDSDDDGDTIPTAQEQSDQNGGDNDGLANYRDTDSDGDGWSDQYEWTTLRNGQLDEDGDGRKNYVDQDSDGDSLLDINELGNQTSPIDSDGDGVQNRLDLDDDGDCVRTLDEIGNPNPNQQADFDGDSIVNYLDTDDDNDGESSCSEDPNGNGNPHDDNTDGDSQPNYVDDDDDDDGILTAIENSQAAGRNPDGDGLANHIDLDSDGDGWLDEDESTAGILNNYDGDLYPDFVDTDSDNDNVPDFREGSSSNPKDTDFDGDIDRTDIDDDDDQIPTVEECSTSCADGQPWNDDFDGDGIADFVDIDDDNDGVTTYDEDVNRNGDPRDDNSDASYRFPDSRFDYLDEDDDGDGLLTIEEDPNVDGQPGNDDTDNDSLPDYRDEDDDGDALFTFDETLLHDQGTGSDDPRDYDFDGDGKPNYLDPDDDNDNVNTFCEITYGVDHLRRDVDGDTILDGDEWYNFIYLDLVLAKGEDIPASEYSDANGGLSGLDCLSPWDRDSDGTINALDSDDDGDGITSGIDDPNIDFDCLPGTAVPAGDGIPAYVDRDSDNDGVPDDASGIVGEGFGDEDGDNIFDFLDCDNTGPNGDSDVDGIRNGDEDTFICAGREVLVPCSLNPDVDNDGVIDGVEVGSNVAAPRDTDGDLEPDVWDRDDDADSRPSMLENGIVGCADGEDPDNEPDLQGLPVLDYTDEIPTFLHWKFVCVDENNPSQEIEFDFGGNDLSFYPNTDHATGSALPIHPDATPDFLDADDDGDGVPSIEEGMGDSDGDGVPNAYDLYDHDGPEADPDGDGIVTVDELDLGDGISPSGDDLRTNPYDDDTDRDGVGDAVELGEDLSFPLNSDDDSIIDALDEDDDNDTLPTLIEGTADPDRDGTPSYLDLDSDNDSKPDSEEGIEDVDCDGVANFMDAVDSDGPCVAGDDSGSNIYEKQESCSGCSSATGSPGTGALLLGLVGALALRRRQQPQLR